MKSGWGLQSPVSRSCFSHAGPCAAAQGELQITTLAGTGRAAAPDQAGRAADLVERVPFLMLALDLPPAPLYKDALEKNIIPQARAAGRDPVPGCGCAHRCP